MDKKNIEQGVKEDESRPAAAGQEDKTQTAAPITMQGARLDTKTESKLLTALGKLFDEGYDQDDIKQYDLLGLDKSLIMDISQILAFKPNNLEAKRILSRFARNVGTGIKTPVLDYKPFKDAGAQVAQYDTEQLALIIGVFNCFKDANRFVKITVKKDLPILLQNEYFTAWLAPRIESC